LIFGLKLIKGVGSGAKHLIEKAKDFDNFLDFIKHFQEDKHKEEKNLIKEINKILKKKKQLLKKESQLTKNGKEIPKEIIDEINVLEQKEIELSVQLENLQKELLNYQRPEKINKRVFEALAKAGAFSSFGYTRKDLVENLKEILSLDFKNLKITKDEYSLSEIIKIEKELMEYIITPIWNEDIYQYDLTGEWKPFFVISKINKKTKNGKDYQILNLINTEGLETSVFDFDNLYKNKINDYYLLKIKEDNNFRHLKGVETIDKISNLLSLKRKKLHF